MKTLVCTVILRISISVTIVGKSLGESDFKEDRNENPYVCFVSIAKVSCTGSILTSSVVLTASQCMLMQRYNCKNGVGFVIAGKQNFILSSAESDAQIQKRKINDCFPYSGYFDIFQDDIMLLKLEKDFEINSYVSPIPVMNRATFPKGQQELCLMLSYKASSKSTMSLEVARVLVEHPDQCLMWTEDHRLSTLCSRYWKPMGVCEGNAGAPLVCQDMLAGLFKAAFVEDVNHASCDKEIGTDDFISFTYVGYYVPWVHIHAAGVRENKFELVEVINKKSAAATPPPSMLLHPLLTTVFIITQALSQYTLHPRIFLSVQ